jgi:hypothetical protein
MQGFQVRKALGFMDATLDSITWITYTVLAQPNRSITVEHRYEPPER